MADVLQKLAEEATYRGDYARAKQLAQKSLEISRPLERADAVANALDKLGYATLYFGELVESERFYREAYAVFQTIGNLLGIALSGGGLAFVASMKGDANREAAYAYTEESLALVTTIGHRFHIATRLTLYQRVAIAYNDYPLAIDCCQKLLAMSELQDISLLAQLALSDLGYAYCQLGDFAEARRCLLDSLDRSKSVPSFPLSMVLVHCSVLRMAEGRRLAGEAATAALGSALSLILFGARQPTLTYEFKQMAARLRAELEAELPPALVAQARARAETLTVADVRNELSTQVTSSTNLYK
jgi:tetratricopeptide (TPR) repeat protein